MRNTAPLLALLLISFSVKAQNIYSCTNGEVTFYSKAPIEDIEATSKSLNSMLNISNNEILFIVPVKSFNFSTGELQEHFIKKKEEFNEKYMESDKFPSATYKGKINDTIDYSKDGEYTITSSGTLTIHGVDKPRTGKGKLIISNGIISIVSDFNVALKDYKVEVPQLLAQNIAEVVNVKFSARYAPHKKDK
jgi:YceI-like protein